MSDPLFAKYGKTVKAGEILFNAGEQGSEMFVVRTGAVRIMVTSQEIEKTLAILGPGEFVGEMSILTNQPRSATAIVEEDAQLLVIGVRVLEEMIIHNTEIALRLIRKLAARLENADALIKVLIYREPNERIIENLKRLAKIHAPQDGGPVRFKADFEAMAEQVGLEEYEVQDIMLKLIGAGFITEKDKTWIISKIEDIDDFLGFLKMKQQYK